MRRRLLERASAIALAAVVPLLPPQAAHADGGALVARGTLANGEPAAVFVAPVPPRVGLVLIEAASKSWRETPPRVALSRGDTILSDVATPSPIDPLASVVEFSIPEAGDWRLVVESEAGRLEATVPIASRPPPWRSRLPWMLAWVPAVALLLWLRPRESSRT